jgi:hypothetical protein
MRLDDDGRVELDPDTHEQMIADCPLCDADGYRLPTKSIVCDHVDRREIAARGIARCREVLDQRRNRNG